MENCSTGSSLPQRFQPMSAGKDVSGDDKANESSFGN
jgi:hypothetical protein